MNKFLLILLSIGIFIFAAYLYKTSPLNDQKNFAEIKRQIREDFPNVNQLSTVEFKNVTDTMVDQKTLLLLDVREQSEYKVSHLKNAILSENIDTALSILKNKPKDMRIVAYCSVGYRSSSLANQLLKHGYTNVSNLEGSIFEWANQDFPIYREGKKVHQVHIYNAKWGTLLKRSYHPKSSGN